VQKTRQNNADGLKFFENAFREMALQFVPSSANFILVRVGDGRGIFTQLQALGVIVRPMDNYGLPEWVRISVGLPRENQRCLQSLRKILGRKK